MGNYQHRRPLLGYFVNAYSAAWIDQQLRDELPKMLRVLRSAGKTDVAEHLEVTMAGIAEAAKAHHARLAENSTEEPKPLEAVPAGPESKPDYLTPKQAAEQLSVTDRQVRNRLNDGRLQGRKIGKQWMVDPASIEDYKLSRDAA